MPSDSQQQSNSPAILTRNKILITIIFILAIGAIMFFAGTKKNDAPKNTQEKKSLDKIVSTTGMHWHSDLTITILGEKQEIPIDVGLDSVHKPIHTHEDKRVHMEFSDTVKESDIALGQFFKNWGKTFNKDCIFDKCNGAEGQVRMVVNGKENSEFERYIMKDNDKIDIFFVGETIPTGATTNTENNQTSQIKEITVIGNDFSFNPPNIPIKAGEPVRITFKNEGKETHNLVIEGLNKKTNTIGSGQIDVLEFIAPSNGIYEFICSVGSHRVQGMIGKIIVEQ